MNAKRTSGVGGLVCCVVACAVGAACSASEPTVQQAIQQREMPFFTQVKGMGEGVLTIEYQREGDAVTLVIRDANRARDTFTFQVVEDNRLEPATKRNRMAFWILDDEVEELERFVHDGSYDAAVPLTTQAAQDLSGYYQSIAVIEDHGTFVIALWSNDGLDVYANGRDAPAIFGFAAAAFKATFGFFGPGGGRGLKCCVNCGAGPTCCCDGGDECEALDREAICKENGKVVERCWCKGSNCACKTLAVWDGGHTMEDQSDDGPGMGNQEE